MSTHSLLSPSAAHRWMACPGSVPLTKDIPNKTSKYAQEGTRAHELAAERLLNSFAPFVEVVTEDKEMNEYVQVYVEEIWRRAHGKLLLVEQRVDPQAVTGSPDHSGTADAVILDMAESTIEVHDLKYGRGHQVFAGDNEQLMLYGLGALCSYDHILEAQTFKLFIHQPRLDHMDEYRLSREQLLAFGEQVKAATEDVARASRSQCDGADFAKDFLNPSDDACRWCDAKPTCPALRTMVTDCVFEAVDKPKDPQTITDLPSARTLSLIEQWCSSVHDLIFAKVNAGEEIAGWKLVMGKKGNRKWKDESTVAGLLKKLRIKKADGFSKPKVKSPAQLEKIVPDDKWDQLEALIEQPPGKPTLVSEDDKRPEHKPVEFEDQTKTEDNR